MNELIAISPSTQRGNKCAVCYSENLHCTQLAKLLAERLHAMGYRTLVFDDRNVGMGTRVDRARKAGASLYLPLHTNAYNRKVRGSRFGYSILNSKSKTACRAFVERWRTVYTGGSVATAVYTFTEARKPPMPSVYVELVFHDNLQDATWLHDNMSLSASGLAQCCDDVIRMKIGEAPVLPPTTNLIGTCRVETKYDKGISLWGTRSRKNVRTIRLADGTKTIYVPKGDNVEVITDYHDGWVIAEYRGVKGLADAQYLKPV